MIPRTQYPAPAFLGSEEILNLAEKFLEENDYAAANYYARIALDEAVIKKEASGSGMKRHQKIFLKHYLADASGIANKAVALARIELETKVILFGILPEKVPAFARNSEYRIIQDYLENNYGKSLTLPKAMTFPI